ncbi:DUF1643 domain-containing protein [Leptolyngbya sp. FACHB-671]|uniref:DUF1643 domain-containing protein n=1 Tax=Leptolyngbya sp. FACHB-671 TaxID=2692812 RepID=UPI0018F05884|nr:DUF1643 domain-containing protein [Leptolyngbya sp. FACHB-671]
MQFKKHAYPSTPPVQLKTGATFDPTGTYRYSLWREWDANAPKVGFIMLNPSSADAEKNDPTIRRCISFAQFWGYGCLEVVNLFAYRATHLKDLLQATDPIGDKNDRYLNAAMQTAEMLVVAWGNWGSLNQRDQAVLQLVSEHRHVCCLSVNRSGQPRHPLYVRSDTYPMPFQS